MGLLLKSPLLVFMMPCASVKGFSNQSLVAQNWSESLRFKFLCHQKLNLAI